MKLHLQEELDMEEVRRNTFSRQCTERLKADLLLSCRCASR